MLARIRAATAGGFIDYPGWVSRRARRAGLPSRMGFRSPDGWNRTAFSSSTSRTGSGACRGSRPREAPHADRLHLGIEAKRAVGIPVIGVGGIRMPDEAEAVLAGGLVDLIAVGRGILADPR